MPNKLIHETSPYLLQHAHNPVDWYPWDDEALQKARKKNKPILVSIGYSACHWCHVMEKESFEDAAVAALMNKNFICIKIDREERPDLDQVFMDAVQAISGSGGWPLNVFLTPDAKPFYGGTYFPPQQIYNRSSWTNVLNAIADLWANKKEDVLAQANNLVNHIQKSNISQALEKLALKNEDEVFTEEQCRKIAQEILRNKDEKWGGFGQPPKFLQLFSHLFLLEHTHFYKEESAITQVEFSLKKILQGGIYDQLAGGISRYSTDARWLVPHFEKMLYDNALLLQTLADVYLGTKDKTYLFYIRHLAAFIETTFKNPQGGYYTALDADSEGVEGKFYVWDKKEIDDLLNKDAEVYCRYYQVTDKGNWEGKNILNCSQTAHEFAEAHHLPPNEFFETIQTCNTRLLQARNKRIPPATDDKIILSYNALLVTAYCKVYAALQQNEFRDHAIQLFHFLETTFAQPDGSLLHTSKMGVTKYPAFLDDYAYLIKACIALQEITGNEAYLYKAKSFLNIVLENFTDEQELFFYFTGDFQKDVPVRKTEIYDSVMPSANAVMAENLLHLSVLFNVTEWKERCMKMIASMQSLINGYPASFAYWALLLQRISAGIHEIAIVGNDYEITLKKFILYFIPNKILQAGEAGDLPLLGNKPIHEEGTYIYVCHNYSCEKPVKSIADALKLLKFH